MREYNQSIVATGHRLVSEAAAEVLREGGNAFDGVVAAGFAGAAVEQCLTSLGGGGFLLARTEGKSRKKEEIFFDFFVDTPGKGLENQPDPHFYPVTVNFGGTDQDFNIGLGSVAVPGTLKGLLHVHERLGRMDLADVLQPAIALAESHILNDFQGVFMGLLYPIMTMSPAGRQLYEPGGQYLKAGQTLCNPLLASFMRMLIDDNKAMAFYEGEIAQHIAGDMEAGQGLLTLEDLKSYKVIERKPLTVNYRGKTLLTSPPPSMGGALIGLSLHLSEQLPSVEQWGTPQYLLQTAAIMQEVEQLREKGVSTPQALDAFIKGQDLPESVDNIRLFSRGTTHVSIADRDGNVAAMTCSNGEGSGYFAPGTGVMLNNMMGEDDLHPDGFHSSPSGQRVGSMMSPSLLIGEDDTVLVVLGSGGSKRIRTAITQVIGQVVDCSRSAEEAVSAPRLFWDGEVMQMEPGYPPEAIAALKEKMKVNVWSEKNVYFGGVHTVIPGQSGVGDPRRGGVAEVVPK